MSDIDEQVDLQDIDADDNTHQACYVFKPFDVHDNEDHNEDNEIDRRPSKRQKIKHSKRTTGSLSNDFASSALSFPMLSHGLESDVCRKARWESFEEMRNMTRASVEEYLSDLDQPVLEEIVHFARSTDITDVEPGKVRTGLVVSGPGTGYQHRLREHWHSLTQKSRSETGLVNGASATGNQVLVDLPFNACLNLQTSLRNIIKRSILAASTRAGIGRDHDCDDMEVYTTFLSKYKRLIPQNFDLELLQLFVEEHALDRIVVSIPDVESFDTSILSQLLMAFGMWSDRIPFVLLLGISTTIDLFEARLAASIIETCIDIGTEHQGRIQIFSMSSPNDLYSRVFHHLQSDVTEAHVFHGPQTISVLNELIQNQSTTVAAFVDALSAAHMAHFYASSLSVLIRGDGIKSLADRTILCTAVRRSHSFQRHCEHLMAHGDKRARKTINEYLTDDTKLWKASVDAVVRGRQEMRKVVRVMANLYAVYEQLHRSSKTRYEDGENMTGKDLGMDLDLYKHLGDLTGSRLFEDIIALLEDTSTTQLVESLDSLSPETRESLRLDASIKHLKSSGQPARRVSAQAKAVSMASVSATSSQSIIIEQLTKHVKDLSFDPFAGNTFLNEAYIINSRQPTLSYFTPRPRHVLERALGKPIDYLGCECCDPDEDDDENGLDFERRRTIDESNMSTHPPTSILYTLLQEAGTTINVRDLFDAFRSRLFPLSTTTPQDETADDDQNGNDNGDDDDENRRERLSMALFYRSLSELKMLGMVKSSTSTMTKKRVVAQNGGLGSTNREPGQRGRGKKAYADIDFIAKTSWAGL